MASKHARDEAAAASAASAPRSRITASAVPYGRPPTPSDGTGETALLPHSATLGWNTTLVQVSAALHLVGGPLCVRAPESVSGQPHLIAKYSGLLAEVACVVLAYVCELCLCCRTPVWYEMRDGCGCRRSVCACAVLKFTAVFRTAVENAPCIQYVLCDRKPDENGDGETIHYVTLPLHAYRGRDRLEPVPPEGADRLVRRSYDFMLQHFLKCEQHLRGGCCSFGEVEMCPSGSFYMQLPYDWVGFNFKQQQGQLAWLRLTQEEYEAAARLANITRLTEGCGVEPSWERFEGRGDLGVILHDHTHRKMPDDFGMIYRNGPSPPHHYRNDWGVALMEPDPTMWRAKPHPVVWQSDDEDEEGGLLLPCTIDLGVVGPDPADDESGEEDVVEEQEDDNPGDAEEE